MHWCTDSLHEEFSVWLMVHLLQCLFGKRFWFSSIQKCHACWSRIRSLQCNLLAIKVSFYCIQYNYGYNFLCIMDICICDVPNCVESDGGGKWLLESDLVAEFSSSTQSFLLIVMTLISWFRYVYVGLLLYSAESPYCRWRNSSSFLEYLKLYGDAAVRNKAGILYSDLSVHAGVVMETWSQ